MEDSSILKKLRGWVPSKNGKSISLSPFHNWTMFPCKCQAVLFQQLKKHALTFQFPTIFFILTLILSAMNMGQNYQLYVCKNSKWMSYLCEFRAWERLHPKVYISFPAGGNKSNLTRANRLFSTLDEPRIISSWKEAKVVVTWPC